MWVEDFIGQKHIINDLSIHVQYSIKEWVPLSHTMFYGMPGLGKTTLANIVAEEIGAHIHEKTGIEITQKSLWGILKKIKSQDVLFIDEIHRMQTKVAEILYGPLQIINNLQLKRNIGPFDFEGIKINPFTLIGATTNAGDIVKPLRDRIVLTYKFELYSPKDLVKILGFYGCNEKIAKIIAKRSRGVPRIALNYFIRSRNEGESIENTLQMFDRIGVMEDGTTKQDIEIMLFLNEKIASSNTICKTLDIDPTEYHEMYEPFLLSNGFIEITAKGRILTPKGKKYIKNII